MNNVCTPLISIIIPTYNVGKYLIDCIESCINQTYKNIEIICVDDGSTDNSFEMLESYSIKDNRIRIIRQSNFGVVIARNRAIKSAKGNFLFFLDADDYIKYDAIEILVDKWRIDKSDIVIANLFYEHDYRFKPMEFCIPSLKSKVEIIKYLMLDKLPMSLGAKLIRKDLFEILEIPVNLKIGEDAYATLTLIDKSTTISFVDVPVYYYVNRSESVTKRPSVLALQSRISFIENVELYFNKIDQYKKNTEFQETLSIFVITQYYSFLRMGGAGLATSNFTKGIEDKYFVGLKNKKRIPFWRRFLIYFSFRNSRLLNLCIFLINALRTIKHTF